MIKFILCDIEGTTSSIDFVHKVLFPYSLEKMDSFILSNKSKLQEIFASVKHTILIEENKVLGDKEAIETLKQWVQIDRKHKALKDLQGLIWEDGFKKQIYKGHMYKEVEQKFKEWTKFGIKLGIYSSGSVFAQKLIFGHSELGDLTKYLSHYFDTTVGHKRDPNSYKAICTQLNILPKNILFLSDIEEELDAAKLVGLNTTLLDRENKIEVSSHEIVANFNKINLSQYM